MLLLWFVAATACDSFYMVQGHVSSCADQRPIEGAMVHLTDERREAFATTTADGSYRAALNEPEGDGPSRLTAAKVGFRTEEHAVEDPHAPQDICLRRETP